MIKYDGFTRLGSREGKGVYYYDNGNKMYDGDWRNDKRDGQGVAYYSDFSGRVKYHGQWKEDFANGFGVKKFEDGSVYYKGEWRRGKKNGEGRDFYYGEGVGGVGKYSGGFLDGAKVGWGSVWFSNGKRGGVVWSGKHIPGLEGKKIPVVDGYGNLGYEDI